MSLDEGETLIGTSDAVKITSTNISKSYCTNCKKRQHCIHGIKLNEGEEVVMLKDKCSNDSCECRCRRFFTARNGRLRPLGTIDKTDALEGFPEVDTSEIDGILEKYNAKNREKTENV